MIQYQRYVLPNGLTVILHPDADSRLGVVNILYRAGSVYEQADNTGIAHLFEHMMFSGTPSVRDFDTPIQKAGGENNAFTSNDYANYYSHAPVENLSLLLWLEADRMKNLLLKSSDLTIQKSVVTEEFYETSIEQPFADFWHLISPLAYSRHHYRWPVIGAEPRHIARINLKQIKNWYRQFYRIDNAILCVAGNINVEKIKAEINDTFGKIKQSPLKNKLPSITSEPFQRKRRSMQVNRDVPANAIYIAFPIPARRNKDFYTIDIIADLLSSGKSSRLHERLIKKKKLFFNIDVFTNDVAGPGLLIIQAKLSDGVDMQSAEAAIIHELNELQETLVSKTELSKVINKTLTSIEFSEYSLVNKAINLAYFEYIGDISLINREIEIYKKITQIEIQKVSRKIFRPDHMNVLYYFKN